MESKLAKCMSTLKRMTDSCFNSTAATAISMGGSGVEETIKEVKAVTIFACSTVVASLSFNTPCRSFMRGAGFLNKKNKINPVPLSPIMDINSMTNMMQRKRSSSLKPLFYELNKEDITVGNLKNVLDRYKMNKTSRSSSELQDELKDSIDVVNMSTTKLESALIDMDNRVNELSRFLISSRVELLNSLTTLCP